MNDFTRAAGNPAARVLCVLLAHRDCIRDFSLSDSRHSVRPMKPWKSQVIVGVVAASLAVLGYWLFQRTFTDRWQPTGDGKTIVNVRTGEIRLAITGERIAPADKENWRPIAIENGRHFNAVQALALSMPDSESDEVSSYSPGGWSRVIDPYANDSFPMEHERDWLTSAIGDSVRARVVSGPRWQELYDHLKAFQYGLPDGVEPMIRSPQQMQESRKVLLGIERAN